MMKAEFMTCVSHLLRTSLQPKKAFSPDADTTRLWDGLTTGPSSRILVLGATNRPNDIDPAILRRMPKRFPIRLPNIDQRLKILYLMLSHTMLAAEPQFSMRELARRTEGLSGSDLRETCRNAAMAPVREVMRERGRDGKAGLEEAKKEVSILLMRKTGFSRLGLADDGRMKSLCRSSLGWWDDETGSRLLQHSASVAKDR